MASIERTPDPTAPRYLVVEVGGQRIAWDLTCIREIVTARAVTRLPGTPEWVLGLLNLRGTVLTVVDLATRLGLASKRHFLHAAWLVFSHPVTGAQLDLRSPLPDDLRRSLAAVAESPEWFAHPDPLEYLGFYRADD